LSFRPASVAFGTSGETIYAGGGSNTVAEISVGDQTVGWKFTADDYVNDIAVSPDGSGIYVASSDSNVYYLDGSGDEKWRFSGHSNGVDGVEADPTNEGVFSAGASDGTVRYISESGEEEWQTEPAGSVQEIGVSTDGERVYTAEFSGQVRAIDDGDGSTIWTNSNSVSWSAVSGGGAGAIAPYTPTSDGGDSGGFEREFQLGQQARYTYPPSLSELTVYRWDTALELPLPGGTTFRAGPGTWTEVATKDINAYGKASVRLEDGTPYRVAVEATSGARSARWESLGWRANKSQADPYLISITGDGGTTTPTPTGTATATTTGLINTDGPLSPPPDPFDQDGDGFHYDYPDTPDTNFTAPEISDGFGPRLAGECIQTDGSEGILVEYWDPSFETTNLSYNLTSGTQSYAGEREFATAVGYTTWCIGDGLTGNASEAPGDTMLSGNYTSGGETFNYTDQLGTNALVGGPLGGGGAGGGGSGPSTGQTVVGLVLLGAVGYVAYRRLGSGAESGPTGPGAGSGGSSSSVLPWRGGD
jgi:hypothetical protein